MKCYFRSFDVGMGDCNVVRIVKDDGEQYVIMVDCGMYTASLKEYLQTELKNRIDLLIVTHIDGDHIQGLTTMLKSHKDLSVGEIWYNAYRRKSDRDAVQLNEQQKEIIAQIQNMLPLEFDAINYRQVSAQQAKSLANVILNNEKFNKVWKREYITCETKDFNLPGNIGKIVFLAPSPDALKVIDEKFKTAFNKYFMQVWNDTLEKGEELQELLIRLVDTYKDKCGIKQISAEKPVYDVKFVKSQAREEAVDSSDTNYSSIAFMLECGDHRIAMLGDSFASTIEESIDSKYKDFARPIACDAIKVSHHGSNGNNSKALMDRISSYMYFIPGGKDEKYPTWGTLGRIAGSYKSIRTKKVIFSHKNTMTKRMTDELCEEVKRELGIETVISEREYELFEW